MAIGVEMSRWRKKNKREHGLFAISKIVLLGCIVLFSSVSSFAEASGSSIISISPMSQTVSSGGSVTVTVHFVPERPVKAFEFKVSFDPSLLQATSVAEGGFFGGFTTFFNPGTINNQAGTIVSVFDLIVGDGNVTGPGVFVTIGFTALSSSGTSAVTLYDVRVTNETEYIGVTVNSATVTVEGSSNPPYSPPPSEPPANPPSSPNIPPAPPLKPLGPTVIELGMSYMYRSSAVDPEGNHVRLRFDWDDESFSNWTSFVDSNTSVSLSHTWDNVSTYLVRVIAQDVNGSNSTWSDPLTVRVSQAAENGSPPVVSFIVPVNASVNQSIFFDASGCYDPDGRIVSYQWDFGDGISSTGQHPTHVYRVSGEFTVTLTVFDSSALNASISALVTVSERSEGSMKQGSGLLWWSPAGGIILVIICAVFVGCVIAFRNNIRLRIVKRRITTSKKRMVTLKASTIDIDEILDALFLNLDMRLKNPSTDSVLTAYSNLIIDNVEKGAAFHIPDLSIAEVERLVDERIQAKMKEKTARL
jgi:PKD repeat protein